LWHDDFLEAGWALNLRSAGAGIGGNVLPANWTRKLELTHWRPVKTIPHLHRHDNAFLSLSPRMANCPFLIRTMKAASTLLISKLPRPG
jgi:hypothetical protein